jgi:hypothetical protein
VFRKKGSRRKAGATLEAQGKMCTHAVVRDRQLVFVLHTIAQPRARKGPCEHRDGGDRGNPAVIGALRIARDVPVDRRLCVPAFRRVCRYHFLLSHVFWSKAAEALSTAQKKGVPFLRALRSKKTPGPQGTVGQQQR